jgi:hypothetical protein
MIKGSLNTMNYLEPNGAFNKFKAFFKRRHTADIYTQYGIYNVRAFDLHIAFTHSGRAYFKYDNVSYDSPAIFKILNFLEKSDGVYVRLVLEGDGVKNEEYFYNYCCVVEHIYNNIHFFGGYRERDAKILYMFKHSGITPKVYWHDKLY